MYLKGGKIHFQKGGDSRGGKGTPGKLSGDKRSLSLDTPLQMMVDYTYISQVYIAEVDNWVYYSARSNQYCPWVDQVRLVAGLHNTAHGKIRVD